MTVHPSIPASNRNIPLAYLRAFITVLVVAHHAFLAYFPGAPPPPRALSESLIWTAFPIVDSQRAPGVDLFIGFNDTFFMSLMFLLAGVFAWSSLKRKGPAAYSRDRAVRLGLPFIVGAGILAPFAYYPSWLQTGGTAGPFWTQWLALGVWPAGPAWFLWVLLMFGFVGAALFAVAPRSGEVLGRLSARLAKHPVAWFAVLIAFSAIAYVPIASAFTAEHWTMFGPFFVQTSRLLHYAVYFSAGLGLGVCGADIGLLAADGKLARRWPLWLLASFGAFVVAIAMLLTILSTFSTGGPSKELLAAGHGAFVLSCASSSVALLALFLRFARRSGRIRDSLASNAYGIFILHYFCVSWLQLALLEAGMSAWSKALIVFSGALCISWSLSAVLRRLPVVRMLLGEGGHTATGRGFFNAPPDRSRRPVECVLPDL